MHATYQVIELYDVTDPTLPVYVAAQRQEESAWRVTWEHRDQLPGRLAAWFRELAAEGREPAERVILGRGVGLPEKAAFGLTRLRVREICRMATGDPDQVPDFLVVDLPANVGKRGRPVVVIDGDRVEVFPSVTAVATAEGVTRATASRRVRRRGLQGRDGRVVV